MRRELSFRVVRRRRKRTHPRRWPWALAGLGLFVLGAVIAETPQGYAVGVRVAEAIR